MGFLTRSSNSQTRGSLASHADADASTLPLQTKLQMGRPGDAFEQEADRVAERVVSQTASESRSASPGAGVSAGALSRSLQTRAEEEETPVQAQMEEEPPIQAQTEEEEPPIQAQSGAEEEEPALRRQPMEDEEETPVQAEARAAPEVADPRTLALLRSSKSGGSPLDPPLLEEMESKFGSSLADVRIHTGATAADLSRRLNARAFTHGRHVYFNEGQFAPESSDGKRLLAHELAHVIQQTGRLERETIQRANGGGGGNPQTPPPGAGPIYSVSRGDYRGASLDTQARRLRIPKISLPAFKRRNRSLFQAALPLRLRGGGRGQTDQLENWRQDVGDVARTQVSVLTGRARDRGGVNNQGMYFFRARNNRSFYLFGDETQLQQRFELPFWDKDERARSFQVDHIVEDQLGGDDVAANYELLDATANMSAGSKLAHQINRRIRESLTALRAENVGVAAIPQPSRIRAVKSSFEVLFEGFDFELRDIRGAPDQYWSREEIKNRQLHTSRIRPLRGSEMEAMGRDGRVVFFTSAAGGDMLAQPRRKPQRNWLPRLDFLAWTPNQNATPGQSAGTLTIDAFKARSGSRRESGVQVPADYPSQAWNVIKVDGIYGGTIDAGSVSNGIRQSLRLPGMSPIQLNFVSLDRRGVLGRGKLLPTVPFIRDADIDILIEGDDVQLRKTFDFEEIQVPAPFALKETTLSVFYGSRRGFGIEGRTGFEIERVGEGFVAAAASTSGGFELEGEFNFDSSLFQPARVGVTYRNNQFGVSGEIGIPQGRLRGVRSANIRVSYAEDNFSASGEAELDIPGVERGTLAVTYTPEGWSIGGSFNLSGDIPGIRSGSISATVRKVAGQEGYRLSARGTAVPDIPGITSQLEVEYDDGAVKIEGRAAYSRGLLSGQINVGASNRTLDADGQPTGPPGDTYIVYGGGELMMQITPWLRGTVGVQFQPNGEIVVSGRLDVPSSVEIFRRIGIPEREVFGLGFDIPIFAIPVGGRSIGLKATIRGGIRVYAWIGAGTLENLHLGVVYNPAHVEDTRVSGGGRFVIPAEAGLKLVVRATVGLDAVIGGVEGGLELAGGLALQAQAGADINVDWSPGTGLELRANLSAFVQPRLTFTIDGVITAWFAVWDKTWRWRLASYEYGPDLRFGVRLPISYREGQPFDISYEDMEFQRPNINASSLLRGLIRDIRDRRS